jgi:hypothetical protein
VPHFLGALHTPPEHVYPAGQHFRPHALATGQHPPAVHFCLPARQQNCRQKTENITPQRQSWCPAVEAADAACGVDDTQSVREHVLYLKLHAMAAFRLQTVECSVKRLISQLKSEMQREGR